MIIHGDSLEELKTLDENTIDSVITDPPYGLSFMNKKWDYDVPSVELWREVLRVLKPGGHLLSFGGTRTYHRMVCAIEDAGFEIRDQIQWLYGSGFPKSHNLDGDWEGWGTALKPANEPIVLARKPLEKGLTVAQNILKWSTGALNIEKSRIDGGGPKGEGGRLVGSTGSISQFNAGKHNSVNDILGRWPANIILDEQAAFDLDEQSGQLSQCGGPKKTTHDKGMFGIGVPGQIYKEEDRGASRFFYCAKASKSERNAGLEGMPERNAPKFDGGDFQSASTSAKNRLNQNHHPTVKPIKLMEYLCRLINPPGSTILDPFMGSGSTGVAAKKLGFKFIGIEREQEYAEIARRRIEAVS